jgi:hypothetical protein
MKKDDFFWGRTMEFHESPDANGGIRVSASRSVT